MNNEASSQRYVKFHFSNLAKLPPIGKITYLPESVLSRIFNEGHFIAEHLEAFPVQKSKGRKKLSPMGFCIYCGKNNDDSEVKVQLTSEHIIPEFLGAALELPESSCTDCQRLTSDFERVMAGELFYGPKRKMGLLGKDGQNQKQSLIVDGGREINEFFLTSASDHPTVLIMPLLYPAASYSSKDKNNDQIFRLAIYNINAQLRLLEKYDTKNFSSQVIDLVKFSQLLCKIAHAYAMHYHRESPFTPLLPEFIRTTYTTGSPAKGYFEHVGSLWNRKSPPTENLHEIEVGEIFWQEQRLCVVRVHLFACLNMPSYYICVGINSLGDKSSKASSPPAETRTS